MGKQQEKQYQALLKKLKRIYESSMVMGTEAQRIHKVRTFLEMGETILAAENGGATQYGKGVMKRISKDFTAQYGGGVAAGTTGYATGNSETEEIAAGLR